MSRICHARNPRKHTSRSRIVSRQVRGLAGSDKCPYHRLRVRLGLVVQYSRLDSNQILVGGLLPFFIFPYIGNFIIPIDFHIFQRGGPTTKQNVGLSENGTPHWIHWFPSLKIVSFSSLTCHVWGIFEFSDRRVGESRLSLRVVLVFSEANFRSCWKPQLCIPFHYPQSNPPVVPHLVRWRKFQNRTPIGEAGCCESWMAERSHWWIYLSIYLSS